MPSFAAPHIMDTARHIDVIWFKGDFPRYCFEVEHSTSITLGLHRLAELEGLDARFTIVAPVEAKGKFDKEIQKALFRSIKSRFTFKSYDELARFLAVTRKFAEEKHNFLGD
jgi:hypothetical protein